MAPVLTGRSFLVHRKHVSPVRCTYHFLRVVSELENKNKTAGLAIVDTLSALRRDPVLNTGTRFFFLN
jgi:hypothetical protein